MAEPRYVPAAVLVMQRDVFAKIPRKGGSLHVKFRTHSEGNAPRLRFVPQPPGTPASPSYPVGCPLPRGVSDLVAAYLRVFPRG